MRSHKQQALVACARQADGRRGALTMAKSHKTQPLSFPMRLPDQMQQEARRLLDASREASNASIVELWPQLDRFAGDRSGPAWKQVEKYLIRRSGHGNRQERNEREQAGSILRA